MNSKLAQSFMLKEDGENYVVTFAHSMIACGPLWARLEREFTATPYQRLDYCRSWYEAQSEPKPTPCSLLISDSVGAPLLFLALTIEMKQGFRVASFMGGTHTNFSAPLFRHNYGFGRDALNQIFQQLSEAAEIDAFLLDKMPAYWDGHQNPLLLLPHGPAADKAYWHRLRPNPEVTLASMRSGNHLKQLRAKRRKLEETGHVECMENILPGERANALKIFLKQKSDWCRENGVPDVFSEAETQKFMQTMAATPSCLRIFTLNVSGEVKAVFLALEHNKRLCGWASSYEPGELSAYSPGDLLLMHVISAACVEGFEAFDLGAGDDAYKMRWLHEEEPLYAAIFGYGWKGKAAAHMLSLSYSVKSAIKKSPQLYSALQKMRS